MPTLGPCRLRDRCMVMPARLLSATACENVPNVRSRACTSFENICYQILQNSVRAISTVQLEKSYTNTAERLSMINAFDQSSGVCILCNSHKGIVWECRALKGISLSGAKIMSTAPSSFLWFPLPSIGLYMMARSRARAVWSRDNTSLRQSWVSAVKRRVRWHTAFQHKGSEMKSYSWGSPRMLQREVVPWCLLLWSGPLRARLEDFLLYNQFYDSMIQSNKTNVCFLFLPLQCVTGRKQ